MAEPVRWYHRVAAWLWPWIGEPLMLLAEPVWEQEAEEEIESLYAAAELMADEEEWIDEGQDRVDPYDVGF